MDELNEKSTQENEPTDTFQWLDDFQPTKAIARKLDILNENMKSINKELHEVNKHLSGIEAFCQRAYTKRG